MKKIDDRDLTPAQKKKILEKFDFTCVYCWNPAETVEHIIPWSYDHDNREENLVAACWLCNLIASNKVFNTFSDKLAHVQNRRYQWIKNNPIPLWTVKEVNELGRTLKKYVMDSVMILDDEEQRRKVKNILLKEGFRIIVGRGEGGYRTS